MTATAEQIAQVRRMVDEPDDANGYTDALIQSYVEAYPAMDERGEVPYTWDTSTQPPTKEDNDDWIPTYDLCAAAADVWDEKAAKVAEDFDFKADGGQYSRSQAVQHCQQRARYYRSRRLPRSFTATMHPKPDGDVGEAHWILNMPEGRWNP